MTSPTRRALRIATRGSPLARWQADRVAALLQERDPGLEVTSVVVDTTADRRLDIPISELGGKGVFAKEVQAAVLEGRADIAVHSAKDLPSAAMPGLTLAAFPERADPRDALVGGTLDGLPVGARVATGSARRRVQLADARPDLTFAGLRGNMARRLAAVSDHDAVVVAAAALDRLGEGARIAERLSVTLMIPQVAQGALAVECREGDDETASWLRAIDSPLVRPPVEAERAFLAELGGDCDLPAGAFAELDAEGELSLSVLLASLDARVVLRHECRGREPESLGRSAARFLLVHAGGQDLLV